MAAAAVVPNKKVVLRRHVTGFPTEEDMEIVVDTVSLRVPEGQTAVLIMNLYLSCDPWMRDRMAASAALALGFAIGEDAGSRSASLGSHGGAPPRPLQAARFRSAVAGLSRRRRLFPAAAPSTQRHLFLMGSTTLHTLGMGLRIDLGPFGSSPLSWSASPFHCR